jgi:hydrogenase-4 membrane subunit HyfE
MLGVKFVANQMIGFRDCLVGTLLPAAVNSFGIMVIQFLLSSKNNSEKLTIVGIVVLQVIMFVIQMSFWARLIKLDDGNDLGEGKAAIVSLFYSLLFVFISFLYIFLFKILNFPTL